MYSPRTPTFPELQFLSGTLYVHERDRFDANCVMYERGDRKNNFIYPIRARFTITDRLLLSSSRLGGDTFLEMRDDYCFRRRPLS